MKRTVFDVANWFLEKESMTPKKLQKLVYYYFAWGQALLQKDVIHKCEFEAWVHGPVNKDLYRKYKRFGWTDILEHDEPPEFSIDEEELLESVWMTYGDKSANELEALTHQEEPWLKARGSCEENDVCTNVIDTGVMREYYLNLYESIQGE